jgi:regulator of sigma E protease
VSYVVDTGFWYPLFVLTGLFSAGLSIANMLPIPALDGGRLFFVLLEWIRGRRIPPEREAAYHFVGIVVLLTLMVIISFNDLLSPLPAINWGGR